MRGGLEFVTGKQILLTFRPLRCPRLQRKPYETAERRGWNVSGRVRALAAACALFLLGATGLTATAASAQASSATTAGKLSLTSLSFAQSTVDASAGGAGVTLDWTVSDSDPAATDVAGDVEIRMAGTMPGTYTGQSYRVTYDFNNSLTGQNITSTSGTAQDASFSYQFAVPQYANAATAAWVVTKVTAQDDQGHTMTRSGSQLSPFKPSLTATQAVDSTAPSYDSLAFANLNQRPYLYDNGVNVSIGYSFEVLDPQSGFWRGSIELSGPDGQTARATFTYTAQLAQGTAYCGTEFSPFDNDVLCDVSVTIPAGAAAGTWTVSRISLTDNAGNVVTYRNVGALPVTITANSVVTASGFSASPNPVNDWGGPATAQLSMAVPGAAGGIKAVYVDGSNADCVQKSSTPVVGANGTVSVPLTVMYLAAKCTILGIAVVDGAGDVSLYGSEYNAPAPGVTITRVPDITPPTATSASLSAVSVPYSPNSGFIGLTVNVDDQVAPVNQISTIVYDSAGRVVGGGDGGVQAPLSGPVTFDVDLPAGLAPGVYSVGFILTDTGGLSAQYGTPNGQPVPGGSLQFTVTAAS